MASDNDENMSPRESVKAAFKMYRELHKNDASMTDTMTEADCRMVQEWLGECWHEYKIIPGKYPQCEICKSLIPWTGTCWQRNRTFKDDTDLMDVFRKLVEKGGQWIDIYVYFIDIYKKETKEIIEWSSPLYAQWLFSPLPSGHWQLAKLLSEAIEEGVVK